MISFLNGRFLKKSIYVRYYLYFIEIIFAKKSKKLLLNNNYPMIIIKKQLHKVITNTKKNNNNSNETLSQNNDQVTDTQTTDKQRRGFLYIPRTSERIQKILKAKINNIELAYRPVNKLADTIFTKTKQKVETKDKTSVVYRIPCKGNNNEKCNKCYVGQTKNQVRKRMGKHESKIRFIYTLFS